MVEDYTNSLLSAVLKAVTESLKVQQMIARNQISQGTDIAALSVEVASLKEQTVSDDIVEKLTKVTSEMKPDNDENLTTAIRNLIEGVSVMQENMTAFTDTLNKQAEFLVDLQSTITDMAEQQQTTSARIKGVELRLSTQSIEEEADDALNALNKTLEELKDLDA
ncbi:MAG: hypothetical protein D8H99_56740 [Streptococcus sp.]|nr:MAG: hypothetical protein D8H99_56740 [Streptococcus sp.]